LQIERRQLEQDKKYFETKMERRLPKKNEKFKSRLAEKEIISGCELITNLVLQT